MGSERRVWVEAEKDRATGGIVLTMKSVAARRELVSEYGVHNVHTSINRLQGFPPDKVTDLMKGWPVQFKMSPSTYRSMLGQPGATRGLAGDDDIEWSCEMCGGEMVPMGALGRKMHARCRQCGAEASQDVEEEVVYDDDLDGLELTRWKDYHTGDCIRITAMSKHFGREITIDGMVYNAQNYGSEEDPNWVIQFDRFDSEYGPGGPDKWEQKKHGGTVEMVKMAQDLSVPPQAQMTLPGVAGFFGVDALDGMRLQVIPAYGRDYKSKKAIIADWNAGKDFVIADMSSQWDTKPVNRQDAVGAGITDLQVRYSRQMKVTVLKLDSTGGAK
jgi:hypothetical protein